MTSANPVVYCHGMLPRASLPSAFALRRTFAEAIAVEAAAILTRHRGLLTDVTWKGVLDLVTIADRESEAFVLGKLGEHFPHDRVIGEEGGGIGPADAEFVWYVDPLDGTTNFVHGLPHFAVSLGCAYRGELVVGVVHAPALALPNAANGITWSAAHGLGATRNGHAIAVNDHTTLRRTLVATGFGADRTNTPTLAQRVGRALTHTLDIRRLGSAALDLCHVADGTFGAYWEGYLKPWDIAAGVVIVREAAGRVTDFAGGADMLGGELVATNGRLHAEFMTAVLQGAAEIATPHSKDS